MRKYLLRFAWVPLTAVFWIIYTQTGSGGVDSLVFGFTSLAAAGVVIFVAARIMKKEN